jgi:hypothetical protein
MKYRLLYAVLFLLSVFFSSCEDKNETDDIRSLIVGAWQLTSVQIDGTNADLTAYPDIIQFQPNYIFQSYNTITQTKVRGGWSYESDMLTVSVYLPAAFYVLKADAQNLSLKRLDFNTAGMLSTTIQEYRRIADSEIP